VFGAQRWRTVQGARGGGGRLAVGAAGARTTAPRRRGPPGRAPWSSWRPQLLAAATRPRCLGAARFEGRGSKSVLAPYTSPASAPRGCPRRLDGGGGGGRRGGVPPLASAGAGSGAARACRRRLQRLAPRRLRAPVVRAAGAAQPGAPRAVARARPRPAAFGATPGARRASTRARGQQCALPRASRFCPAPAGRLWRLRPYPGTNGPGPPPVSVPAGCGESPRSVVASAIYDRPRVPRERFGVGSVAVANARAIRLGGASGGQPRGRRQRCRDKNPAAPRPRRPPGRLISARNLGRDATRGWGARWGPGGPPGGGGDGGAKARRLARAPPVPNPS
jgi:hypothetical protein